ncbi:carbohydrate sulfotransferase 13 [Aplysia californica]|uniref:Carbohydrate sulfotransferase n=1 Tax=Aplysia californica TaxID=6500 RepID=A0ABM0JS02_APLCA|nr:carbohydrate sulfotransferase 13 [Aplysia californica]
MWFRRSTTQRCLRRYVIGLSLAGLALSLLLLNRRESRQGSKSSPRVSRTILHDISGKMADKVFEERDEATWVTGVMEPDYMPTDGLADVDQDMALRKARVASVCEANPHLVGMYTNNSIVSARHRFLYCPVPKVASTFWTRFFYQLMYTDPVGSPFDVPVTSVLPIYFYKFKLKEKTFSELTTALSRLHKLVYVRDPYSRLYSAFVDKIIAPNPFFWRLWGKPAIQRYRKSSGQSCGQDMTFSEYISLTVDSEWKTDVHMQPVYHYCPPCIMNFTVIGKMETFQRDAMKTASLLNISEKQIAFDRMEKDAVDDAIFDSAKDSLSDKWLKLSLQCVSRDQVMRRILRKVQLRGIVSWRFKYPYSRQESKMVSLDKYVRVLTEARDRYLNKTELKIQKKQAYLEAFYSVPQPVLQKLDDIYKLDALFFGYEKVGNRFKTGNRLPLVHTGAFDLTREWDLSPVL